MALRDVPRGVVDRWSALLLVVTNSVYLSKGVWLDYSVCFQGWR